MKSTDTHAIHRDEQGLLTIRLTCGKRHNALSKPILQVCSLICAHHSLPRRADSQPWRLLRFVYEVSARGGTPHGRFRRACASVLCKLEDRSAESDELQDILEQCASSHAPEESSDPVQNGDVRAILLEATGPTFSSGHDFRDFQGASQHEQREVLQICGNVNKLLTRVPQERDSLPVGTSPPKAAVRKPYQSITSQERQGRLTPHRHTLGQSLVRACALRMATGSVAAAAGAVASAHARRAA
eukprot:6204147-Pleurochrysis_carterae.AAC.2